MNEEIIGLKQDYDMALHNVNAAKIEVMNKEAEFKTAKKKYFDAVGREDTQGLIRKDLLL
jgi:hypothetical protein